MAVTNEDLTHAPERMLDGWLAITPKLRLSVSTDNAGSLLFRLQGELRVASADHFAEHMSTALAKQPAERVILGLEDLDYLDLAGATAIVDLSRSMARHDRRLVLLGPSRAVALVLDLLELTDCIE